MKVTEVIIRPLLTEKATALAQNKVYVFEVDEKASKGQISAVISKLYKVKVASVRTLKHKGKMRRAGRSMKMKQQPDKKIAIVNVSEGEINLFPQS